MASLEIILRKSGKLSSSEKELSLGLPYFNNQTLIGISLQTFRPRRSIRRFNLGLEDHYSLLIYV